MIKKKINSYYFLRLIKISNIFQLNFAYNNIIIGYLAKLFYSLILSTSYTKGNRNSAEILRKIHSIFGIENTTWNISVPMQNDLESLVRNLLASSIINKFHRSYNKDKSSWVLHFRQYNVPVVVTSNCSLGRNSQHTTIFSVSITFQEISFINSFNDSTLIMNAKHVFFKLVINLFGEMLHKCYHEISAACSAVFYVIKGYSLMFQ